MKRILLGHLGSNGDCLYATTVARQIKTDFPGCRLTWAISSLCRGVIENNPDVDEVWELPMQSWADMTATWHKFEAEARAEVDRGRYDHAFFTQISPNFFANYDGTIRPSIFRNYPHPITVPVETTINLTDDERRRVQEWIDEKRLSSYEHVVIFECSSKSGQSFVTPALALEISERVLARVPGAAIILSTHEKIASDDPRIIHGGALGMRETAALTHAASLFVGCGSGLTVVATSGAAKPELPNIQILSKESSVYASFRHDFEYFGKPSGHFLEMTSKDPDHLAGAVITTLTEGLAAAKSGYDEKMPLTFNWYFDLIDMMLLRPGRYIDAAQSLITTARRYGWREDLLRFGEARILPNLRLDERGEFPRGAATLAEFETELREGLRKAGLKSVIAPARRQPADIARALTSRQALGAVSKRWQRLRSAVGQRLRRGSPALFRLVARAETLFSRLFR